MTSTAQTTTVAAEDAPIGIQIWPTTSPEYAPNFTLCAVEVITRKFRDVHGTYERTTVEWHYENGNVRYFDLGQHVAVQYC
jgi:hypothetical protein